MKLFKNWIEKRETKKMYEELRERQKQILKENYNNTFCLCMNYVQRKELETTGLLLPIRQQVEGAKVFFENMKSIGLIDSTNKPLASILETLKGE